MMPPQAQQMGIRHHPIPCGIAARIFFSLKEAVYKRSTNAGDG